MTTEEKARKYDEALEIARKCLDEKRDTCFVRPDVIFPELKESEDDKIKKSLIILLQHFCKGYRVPGLEFPVSYKDMLTWVENQGKQKTTGWTEENERIRKALIDGFTVMKESKNYGNTFSDHKIPLVDILAWLEKQNPVKYNDENDERIRKELLEHCRKQAEMYNTLLTGKEYSKVQSWIDWLEKQAKQKSVDKVIPKFNIGDFIVNDYCFGKVIEITNDAYLLDTGQGIPFSCEHNAHLFNDGTSGVLIYKDNLENGGVLSHCRIIRNIFIDKEESGWGSTLLSPATKEQRDLLFQKMYEAGYEWDADKKELRKIEKPKWTEEDEKNLFGIIDEIEANKSDAPDYDLATYDRFLFWLKTLKQRIL